MRTVRRFIVAAGVLAACALSLRASQNAVTADIVLANGKIITVDANDRIGQAVAIAGGRILAVGQCRRMNSEYGNAMRHRTVTLSSAP